MAKVPRAVIKEYFQTGDRPTQPQFSTMLDSMVNFVDDRSFIGLREYNPALDYIPGDCAVFNDQVVKCITPTTGVFNPAHWTILAAFGSVSYAGTWDTQANNPTLQSSVGTKGFYYVVINASPDPNDNTTLNGINDWGIGDWAIYNGTVWEKVDNSEAPVMASAVSFTPTSSIAATNVQAAIEEVDTDLTLAVNTRVDRSGDTMLGDLILNADPTLALGAATKQYVDAIAETKLDLTGGTLTGDLDITGDLTLSADPTAALGAATKQYVDAVAATKLDLTGGTLSGDLDITGDLTLSTDPTTALGAATKQYVDAGDAAINTIVTGKVNRSGDTMTGNLILNADPTNVLGAATKQYVDAADASLQTQINTKLDLSGGTMTGLLTLSADPVSNMNAATKQFVDIVTGQKLNLTGGTLSGPLILNANPSQALGAATKQYVDSGDATLQTQVNDKVNRSGDTMTGDLVLNADPTAALGAVTKQYVDAINSALTASINTKVSKAGDTMTGLLTLSGDPTSDMEAATKQYVDARTQKFVLPITFANEFAVSGTDFVRIPLQIAVPPAASVFAVATQIEALLCVDYITDSGTPSLEGEAAIAVWDGSMIGIPTAVSGSTVALTTVSQWTRVTGVTPFILPASRTYQVIFRKTVGQVGRRIRIEAASLILFYS